MIGVITRNIFKASQRDVPQPITCGLCGLGILFQDARAP